MTERRYIAESFITNTVLSSINAHLCNLDGLYWLLMLLLEPVGLLLRSLGHASKITGLCTACRWRGQVLSAVITGCNYGSVILSFCPATM